MRRSLRLPDAKSIPDAHAESKRDSRTGVLLLIASAALWSLSGTFIKGLNQSHGVPGIAIAFYRSTISGIMLLPVAIKRRESLRFASPMSLFGSIFFFTAMTATFVIATTRTAAANAIILQYTAPVWVFLLSPLFLKERPRLVDSFALLFAMAGIAVIYFGNRSGDASALFIALTSGWAFGSLIVILRSLRRVDPIAIVCMNCLGSGALLAIPVFMAGAFALTPARFLLLLLFSFAQFALPYLLFSFAVRTVEAHRASLILLLETILNPLWTYLFIGERVPVATLAGGALILAGVAGWSLQSWRREAEALRRAPVS